MWKIIPLFLLVGCGPISTKLDVRRPDASLLVPCETPAKLPVKPTNSQIAKHDVDTTRIALDCKAKDDGLIEFENAGPK